MTPRTVHVEHVMGTTVSFDVRDVVPDPAAVGRACAWLHHVDATFSTYRPDSAISRIGRGELLPFLAGGDVAAVLEACAALREQTGGAFDVRATGRLDPSGYVKGWSIQRAADLLTAAGLRHFQVNAGGDIVVRGDAQADGEGWRIGIRHPDRGDAYVAVVVLHDEAVATSAGYERAEHIVDPASGRPACGLQSTTVVADDLGTADAWATALYARGDHDARMLVGRPELRALLVAGQTVAMTPGFPLAA